MSRDMTGEADGEMLSFRTSSRSEKWGDAGDRERCQDKFNLVDYTSAHGGSTSVCVIHSSLLW